MRCLAVLFGLVLLSNACKEKNPDQGYTAIPERHISREININDPEYSELHHPGGYIYLDNEGFRGLIVIRTMGDEFKALERACPSAPEKDCAKATVIRNGFTIQCGEYVDSQFQSCTPSRFSLDGSYLEGPATQDLKEYSIHVDGDYLSISNSRF